MSGGAAPAEIVLCADERYALPLAVAASSIASHAGVQGDLTVVDCGLSATSRDVVAGISGRAGLGVRFVEPPDRTWSSLPAAVRPWITTTTYARLLLPGLLPAATRVLYLDVDTVVRGPLHDLLTMPLEDHAIAAARDFGIPFVASRGGVQNWSRYRGDPWAPYFNAGVLLLDLDRIRSQGLFEQAWEYCVESRERPAGQPPWGVEVFDAVVADFTDAERLHLRAATEQRTEAR